MPQVRIWWNKRQFIRNTIENGDNAEAYADAPVALKLMRNRAEFETELSARVELGFNLSSVIGVLGFHLPESDTPIDIAGAEVNTHPM